MKRYLGAIALSLMAIAVPAQSVWTGNAAVGEAADFPGESAVMRAASNSFPSGTELLVTNPRGGQSVEVTVTGRLETPGVFILIERSAAQSIELPTDHVLPVRVTPMKSDRSLSPTAVVTNSGPLSDDGDYNPAASLPDDLGEVRTAPAPSTTPQDEEPTSSPDDAPLIVAQPVETPPKKLKQPIPEQPEIDGVEPVSPKPETILTYDLTGDENIDDMPEDVDEPEENDPESLSENNVTEDSSGDDRVVYFLTPSDLKPPPAVNDDTSIPSPKDDKPATTSALVTPDEPPSVSRPPAASALARVSADDSRAYIQIGAYKNQAVLEDTAVRLKREAPGYPLSYAVNTNSGIPIYKLLIGPLRPAETGVVLENARSTVFPDAFPYAK